MSTDTRRLPAPLHFKTSLTIQLKFVLTLLISAVMLSGLGVIYMCNANRHLITAFEDAQAYTVYLETEWDKLLLERSAWSSQSRIQQIAENSFGMMAPDPRKIVTIKLES